MGRYRPPPLSPIFPLKKKRKETNSSFSESSVPPTLLATLITAQHARPLQLLPLSFAPVLLLSSYLNIYGHKVDSAGIGAAWSGLYLLLARRRKQTFASKFGVRGVVRGGTTGLCVAQVVSGGMVYAVGKGEREEEGESV